MQLPQNLSQSIFNGIKLVSVEPYLFLLLFGYSVRLVTFQSLLMDRACRNLHMFSDDICNSLDNYKNQQVATIETANYLFAGVMLVASLPAILVAIFLGPWSDKYSRKYPLLIAILGMTLESIASSTITYFPELSPYWFFASSFFEGFFGGYILCLSAAFSYMSDITDERSRSTRYAILEFSTTFAIILGNLIGGEIFKTGSFLPAMLTASSSFGVAMLYTAIFVKDTKTRTPDQTWSVMIRDLVTVNNIKDSYRTCSKKRPGNIRMQIWLLVWTSCSQRFVDMGALAILYSYTRQMYKWDVTDFSQAGTAFNVVIAFATVAIVPMLSSKLRLHEAALGLIGMLSLTSRMVITSVAFKEHLLYYAWMGSALSNAAGIAIRARLSKLVGKEELGRAFSLLGTCESVTPLLGTLAFVQMYNSSANVFPGLPYAIAAVLLLPSVLIFYWMMNLPTISLGDYAHNDDNNTDDVKQMEVISCNYKNSVDEEKF